MDFNRLVDRIVSSILFSLVMFFFSFSFMTGKFPPSKNDMVRAFTILKQMVAGNKSIKAEANGLGEAPTIEQIEQFQRHQLQQTQITMELYKIFEKLPMGAPNEAIATKLKSVSENLKNAENDLRSVAAEIQSATMPH